MSEYTPEKVSQTSGLSIDQLKLLADVFANPKLKVTSLWCMGMNQHTQGTAINNLVHGIHLLSGHWGRLGDGPQSLTGQPSACGTVREVGTLAHALPGDLKVEDPHHREIAEKLWRLPAGRINPQPGHHTVVVENSYGFEGTRRIDTTVADQSGMSLPNTQNYSMPPSSPTPLIVSDVYPNATTELADSSLAVGDVG
jgi:nitrate reductase NapA